MKFWMEKKTEWVLGEFRLATFPHFTPTFTLSTDLISVITIKPAT